MPFGASFFDSSRATGFSWYALPSAVPYSTNESVSLRHEPSAFTVILWLPFTRSSAPPLYSQLQPPSALTCTVSSREAIYSSHDPSACNAEVLPLASFWVQVPSAATVMVTPLASEYVHDPSSFTVAFALSLCFERGRSVPALLSSVSSSPSCSAVAFRSSSEPGTT